MTAYGSVDDTNHDPNATTTNDERATTDHSITTKKQIQGTQERSNTKMVPGGSTDNSFKSWYAYLTIISYCVVVVLSGRITINFQLAIGVFIIFQLWGLLWIKILVFSPNIYSIIVPTVVLSDWIQLSLPSTDAIKIRKDRVVTSISELSGIRGTHMMVALRVVTATINMLVFVSIQADLHYRNTVFGIIKSGDDMVPVCMFISVCGLFFTGHFELNMMDKYHAKGHYLGVLGIFVGSLSIGFSLKWNVLSMFLIAIQFGTCFYWFLYCVKIEKKSTDLNIVTKNSKMCIGIELAMFYVTNVIMTLTVYSSGQNEGNIWVSPFLR